MKLSRASTTGSKGKVGKKNISFSCYMSVKCKIFWSLTLKKEIPALSWSISIRVFSFSKLNSFVPIGMGNRVIWLRPRFFFLTATSQMRKIHFIFKNKDLIRFNFFVFIFPPFNLASLTCC